MIDDIEKRIIHYLQGDLPLTPMPFAVVARKVGISQEELFERIKGLKQRGVLRRFGASLDHRRVGFKANAMVVWWVPEDKIDEVGTFMASLREVSHCYQRKPHGEWKYNLFTMVHAKSKKEFKAIVKRISEKTGIKDYVTLLSIKEFKKTSPEYF